MSISKKYSPQEVEDHWYGKWQEDQLFRSRPNPEKQPYTIVIPPPNVTGVLHMGHMLNNTIQDVLTRRARMMGYEACWVPGTDHASIATEAKVVNFLKQQGIKKSDLSRDDFLKHAWEWKEKHGGIILEQLKKLGASCDWDRTTFTMDDGYYKSVIRVFVDLYKKGYIYRGYRMVNWDPEAKTALSNEEVIYREVASKLYQVKYQVEGEADQYVEIATTRPETILGDTAVCVNPKDDRYRHLHGKKVLVPFINRSIPVITDEYVDMEFGTGCLKITPAHDENDYVIGQKHDLEIVDILNPDGTLNASAQLYVGEDRFAVRKKIVDDLREQGSLTKEEDYTNKVGFSERTDAVIEPRLSLQWFLSMKDISKPALKAVVNDDIQLHPAKFKNTYKHWMENVIDWCISRQLWWGHRIPAYYYGEGDDAYVVAETPEEALKMAREASGNANLSQDDLRQDEDVLDTWASSWLWPIEVFNGIQDPDNDEINYYYPTNDLVTAPEILFFWVARMIIAGYEYRGTYPFKNVYLTGIVRDKHRRKMSKSLGNSPDPLELIKAYGADGVRTGMLFSSPAGNDLLFDEKLCEQGRNFANKIWNAFRLVKGWETDQQQSIGNNRIAVDWFESRFAEALTEIEDHFSKYRISDALMVIYKLIWDDFCSWYLEMIKPAYESKIDEATYDITIRFFEKLMKVLHPFMPFITEEIYQNIDNRRAADYIMVSAWPQAGQPDHELLKRARQAFELVSNLRNFRGSKQISPKEALDITLKAGDQKAYEVFEPVIQKLANVGALQFTDLSVQGAPGFHIGTDECFVSMEGKIDASQEKEETIKELEYLKGFLKTVEKKLGNERFVQNAPPEVVEKEKQKKADALKKIKALEEKLRHLEKVS